MDSHRLFRLGDISDDGWDLDDTAARRPPNTVWVLAWDEAVLTLDDSRSRRVIEIPTGAAHCLFDLHALYVDDELRFVAPHEPQHFEKHPAAASAVRRLVEASLASDPAFCAQLRRDSLRAVWGGLFLFVVAGIPFGVYCWWASWAPDPPPDHWVRSFGWAVSSFLFILMSVALAGPFISLYGLRQWLRTPRIEGDTV